MENKDRKLIQAFQKYAQGLIQGCKGCDRDGWAIAEGWGEGEGPDKKFPIKPCPTCAPIRGLEFYPDKKNSCPRVENFRANEPCSVKDECEYKTCDAPNANPDLTTKLHGTVWYVRHVMEVLGLWREFKHWFAHLDWSRLNKITGEHDPKDILTNGTDLRDAALAFMEEVKS